MAKYVKVSDKMKEQLTKAKVCDDQKIVFIALMVQGGQDLGHSVITYIHDGFCASPLVSDTFGRLKIDEKVLKKCTTINKKTEISTVEFTRGHNMIINLNNGKVIGLGLSPEDAVVAEKLALHLGWQGL